MTTVYCLYGGMARRKNREDRTRRTRHLDHPSLKATMSSRCERGVYLARYMLEKASAALELQACWPRATLQSPPDSTGNPFLG